MILSAGFTMFGEYINGFTVAEPAVQWVSVVPNISQGPDGIDEFRVDDIERC